MLLLIIILRDPELIELINSRLLRLLKDKNVTCSHSPLGKRFKHVLR